MRDHHSSWMERLKPAGDVRTHLVLAGTMWTVVGATLTLFGGRWLWHASPRAAWWLAALALVVGVLKSRFVLDTAAGRIVSRIRLRGDGRCLGGVLSPGSWGLVFLMAAAGRVLRSFPGIRVWVGFVYIAVGCALLVSSRIAWSASREWQSGEAGHHRH